MRRQGVRGRRERPAERGVPAGSAASEAGKAAVRKGGNRARGGGGVEERPKRARPALYRDRGGETEAGEPWARPHPALTTVVV